MDYSVLIDDNTYNKSADYFELLYRYYYNRGLSSIMLRNLYYIVTYIIVLSIVIIPTVLYTNGWLILLSVISAILFIHRLINSIRNISKYYPISEIDINKPWSQVANDISRRYNIDILDLHQLIMRRDNYILAIFNQVFDKLLFGKIPIYYSISFEWALNLSVWSYVFNQPPDRLNANHLRLRIILTGIIYLIILPFVLCYILIYYIFNYLDHVRNHPIWLLDRKWNRYAYWKLRNYNEVLHLFERRLEQARLSADKYIELTNINPMIIWLTKIVRFCLGTILFGLTISGSYDINIIGILGIIMLSIYRLPSKILPIAEEADEHLSNIRLILGSNIQPDLIKQMYQYRIKIFVIEIISLIAIPIYFILRFHRYSWLIVDYIKSITEYRLNTHLCKESNFNNVNNDDKVISSILLFNKLMTK